MPLTLVPITFCPKYALPSWANLDVPHPLSIAACAITRDIGIISILFFSSAKSLFLTLYSLNNFFKIAASKTFKLLLCIFFSISKKSFLFSIIS